MSTTTTAAPMVPIEQLLIRKFSLFDSMRAATPTDSLTLWDFVKDVRNGRWSKEIKRIHAADPEQAKSLKEKLPATMPSGVFTGLTQADLVAHSGLLCMDLDKLGFASGRQSRVALMGDPHVIALFTSPRGSGIKFFVPIPPDPATHKASFEAAYAYFSKLLPTGICLDRAPSSQASKCFVSFDPHAWLATTPRTAFQPINGAVGCHIAIGHAIQSNEKEPSLPSASGPKEFARTGTDPSESEQGAVSTRTPPPAPVSLPPYVESRIWPGWVGNVAHHAGRRNEVINRKIPILLNVVHEDVAVRLLLRWFDAAPPGTFKDSRDQHWYETTKHIEACLKSWPKQERIHPADVRAYHGLRDDRQRAAFRICYSLSLTKENRGLRRFFISAGQLANRLGANDSKMGARQLDYLINAAIIEQRSEGQQWAPGQKARSAVYQWLLG